MTSYLQRPLELGADIVLYSATKYYVGHSDIIAGLVLFNDDDLFAKLKYYHGTLGATLDPFSSFLLARGIKTLPLRMDRQNENALRIAEYFEASDAADKVYYPGLKSDLGYEVQNRQAKGSGKDHAMFIMTGDSEARKEGFIKMKELKEAGRQVVGTYCSYTPVELIEAAGAIQATLCAVSQDGVIEGEKTLPQNLCPLVKASYGMAASDKCPYFHFSDMVIAETTCDGKKKMMEFMSELRPTHVMQFCHTYAIEAVKIGKFVREELGLPYLALTSDYSDSDQAQMATRINAFVEMLQ